jgi:hypothetical protein
MKPPPLPRMLFRVRFPSAAAALPALRALAQLVAPPQAALLGEEDGVALLIAGGAGRGGAATVVLEGLGLSVTRVPAPSVSLRPIPELLAEALKA